MTRRLVVPFTLVALAGLVLAGSATTATTPTKPYTANICASGDCVPPVVPPTLSGGSTTTVQLTIDNQASQQSLGSANVEAPTGFKVTGVSPSPTGSSVGGTLVELRNLNIPGGSYATFTITMTVPCQQPADPSWRITAKQSNNYNGPPGNNFTRVDPSSLTTLVTGGCKLVFVEHPQDAQVGRTITSVDYAPAAGPVTVQVRDASDALVTTASGAITLTASSNVSAFSGNTNVAFTGGIATFPALQSGTAGVYTLTASGTGYVSSDPSSSFEIGSKLVFLTQPQDAETDDTITSADFGTVPPAEYVRVAVVAPSDTDPWNPITTATGSATLTPSSGTSFSGTDAAFSAGVATFPSLASSATGSYTVAASSSGSTSATSEPFAISDFGTTCPAGDTLCQGSAESGDKKTSASVTSTTPDGFDKSTTLAITMLASGPPAGACDGFAQLPGSEGVFVDVRPLTDMTEITIRLNKTLVNAKPNNGAAQFEVCFGGKIVGESPATTPFTTKDGSEASYDAGSDLFWGLLPDCSGTPTEPCVQSRNKDKSGDVIVVFAVPFPWDPIGYSG